MSKTLNSTSSFSGGVGKVKPNFKHPSLTPSQLFTKADRYRTVLQEANGSTELIHVGRHLEEAVQYLQLPIYSKRLQLSFTDDAQHLAGEIPLARLVDPVSLEWTEYEEKQRKFIETVLPVARALFLHETGIEPCVDTLKYDTIVTHADEEGKSGNTSTGGSTDPSLQFVSYISKHHRVLVHCWKSRRAAREFQRGWKAVWSLIGAHRLTAIAAPVSAMTAFEGRVVSITWIPSVGVPLAGSSSSQGIHSVHQYQLLQLYGLMGVPPPLSPSGSDGAGPPRLFRGHDGRAYLLSLDSLLVRPFTGGGSLVATRCMPRPELKEVIQQSSSCWAPGNWEDRLRTETITQVALTLVQYACKLPSGPDSAGGGAPTAVALRIIKERTSGRGIAQQLHRAGLNVSWLGHVYCSVVALFQKEQKKEDRDKGWASSIEGLLMVLESELAVRTVRTILRYEFCQLPVVELIKETEGAGDANKSNSGSKVPALFSYQTDVTNCVCKLMLLQEERFWNHFFMPLLREKFDLPSDFTFYQPTPPEDFSQSQEGAAVSEGAYHTSLPRGVVMQLLVQCLTTECIYTPEEGRFTHMACPSHVQFVGPMVPTWGTVSTANSATPPPPYCLFQPSAKGASRVEEVDLLMRSAVATYNILSQWMLSQQQSQSESNDGSGSGSFVALGQDFETSFLTSCWRLQSCSGGKVWSPLEKAFLFRLWLEVQQSLGEGTQGPASPSQKQKRFSIQLDQRQQYCKDYIQVLEEQHPDNKCYQGYLCLRLAEEPVPGVSVALMESAFRLLYDGVSETSSTTLGIGSKAAIWSTRAGDQRTDTTMFSLSKFFAAALTACQRTVGASVINYSPNTPSAEVLQHYWRILEIEWKFAHRIKDQSIVPLIVKQHDVLTTMLVQNDHRDEVRHSLYIGYRGLVALLDVTHPAALVMALRILQSFPNAGFDDPSLVPVYASPGKSTSTSTGRRSLEDYATSLSSSSDLLLLKYQFLQTLYQFRNFSNYHQGILDIMVERDRRVAEWVAEFESKGSLKKPPSVLLRKQSSLSSPKHAEVVASGPMVTSTGGVPAPSTPAKSLKTTLKEKFNIGSSAPQLSTDLTSPSVNLGDFKVGGPSLTNILVDASRDTFATRILLSDGDDEGAEGAQYDEQEESTVESLQVSEEKHRQVLAHRGMTRPQILLLKSFLQVERTVGLREYAMSKKFLYIEAAEPVMRSIVLADEQYYLDIIKVIYFDDVDTRRRVVAQQEFEWRQLTSQIWFVLQNFSPSLNPARHLALSERSSRAHKKMWFYPPSKWMLEAAKSREQQIQASEAGSPFQTSLHPTSLLFRFLRSQSFGLLLAHEKFGMRLLAQTQHDYAMVFSFLVVLDDSEARWRSLLEREEQLGRIEAEAVIIHDFAFGLEAVERENIMYVFDRVREVIHLGIGSPMVRKRMISSLPPSGANLVSFLHVALQSTSSLEPEQQHQDMLYLSPHSRFAARIGSRAFSRLNAALLWHDTFAIGNQQAAGESGGMKGGSCSIVEDSLLLSAAISPEGFLTPSSEREVDPVMISALRMKESDNSSNELRSGNSSPSKPLNSSPQQKKLNSLLTVIQQRRTLAEDVVAAFINVANIFSSGGDSSSAPQDPSSMSSCSLKSEMALVERGVLQEGYQVDPMPIISQIGQLLVGGQREVGSNAPVQGHGPKEDEGERDTLRRYYYQEMSLEAMGASDKQQAWKRHPTVSAMKPEGEHAPATSELDISCALVTLLHRTGKENLENTEVKARTRIYTIFFKEHRQRLVVGVSSAVLAVQRSIEKLCGEEAQRRAQMEFERFVALGEQWRCEQQFIQEFKSTCHFLHLLQMEWMTERNKIHISTRVNVSRALLAERETFEGSLHRCLVNVDLPALKAWFDVVQSDFKEEIQQRRRAEVLFRKEAKLIEKRSSERFKYGVRRLEAVLIEESIDRSQLLQEERGAGLQLLTDLVAVEQMDLRKKLFRNESRWREYYLLTLISEPLCRQTVSEEERQEFRGIFSLWYWLRLQMALLGETYFEGRQEQVKFSESAFRAAKTQVEMREFRILTNVIIKELKQRHRAEAAQSALKPR